MPHATISSMLVRPLPAALEGVPGALETFWRSTDLTAAMVADPEARVSPAQLCAAWGEALRLSGDSALALRIAEATPAGAFGLVEYVCRSAPTLGAALRQWVRYLKILDDAVEVGLVDQGPAEAMRVLVESAAPAPASHELCFALVVRHARAMLGARFRASRVRFRHRASPGQLSRYRSFFDAEVEFGARHTELSIPKSVMDLPLPTADPNLLAVLVPTAEERRARQWADAPLAEQVRRALRGAMSTDAVQLETIAQRLGLTGRSLQRRLKDEGSSFQVLRDELRLELAGRYLGEGLSTAEISFLLGFSEPSAFFRAFKRWTGLTPLEHRSRVSA